MTENNAAHQNYLAAHRAVSEVLEANSVFVGGKTINAIVDAALSKLRAEGVQAGDERALFEWHNRACELTRDEDVPDEYRNSHVQECWNGWKDRAALASAEETRPAARVAGDDASRYLEWDKNRSAWEMPVGTPLFYGNRSPVADESPMAKMADALREKARQEQQAYQDSRVQSTEWGPMPHGTEADLPASAPVAVLSDADIREVFLAHGFTIKDGQADLKPYVYEAARALIAVARIAADADKALGVYAARESAPVAGEAIGYIRTSEVGKSTWLIKGLTFRTVQDHKADPTGETWTRVYAAPQASEAEQSIIAAFLERSGQWLTNDAITTAARNAALEEAAVACKESSMMNVDSYCGATASMCADRIRSLKNRAALSAQPGAQKNCSEAADAARYRLAVADCILILRGDAALGRAEWDSKLDNLAKAKGAA